jgi:hypothetical protein
MAASTPNKSPNLQATKDGSPDPSSRPSIAISNNGDQNGPRRSSFGFLRGSRSASGGKMSRKQKAQAQEEALRKQREAAMLPKEPPRLPTHSALPQLQTFGGENARPDSYAIVSNRAGGYSNNSNNNSQNFSRPSVDSYRMTPSNPNLGATPPVPGSSPSYMDYDPYPRTESMTHRGRFSYASSQHSINSPRRVRRRKDPTPFK